MRLSEFICVFICLHLFVSASIDLSIHLHGMDRAMRQRGAGAEKEVQVHIAGQALAWILSRVLNFFWLSKIVRIVLRGGHKQHFDENKLD